jgi:hypothetical protein
VLGASSATALARRSGSARSLLAAELVAAPFGLLIPLATPGAGLALMVAGGALGAALGLRPALWILMSGLALTGLILLAGPLRRQRDLPDRPV